MQGTKSFRFYGVPPLGTQVFRLGHPARVGCVTRVVEDNTSYRPLVEVLWLDGKRNNVRSNMLGDVTKLYKYLEDTLGAIRTNRRKALDKYVEYKKDSVVV